LTITGAAASTTHTASVSLVVTAPVTNDFSISASPASRGLVQRAAGSATISTAVTAGSAATVSLVASGAPAGATAILNQASVLAGGSATLNVNAGTAAAGSYTLTVTGTEGTAIHSTTVSLTVTAPAGRPGAPTLTATRSGRRGVQLSWTVPASNGSPINAYRIYRSLRQGGEAFLIQRGAGSTSYRDTSASSGTRYYYQITAVNGVGEGPRSNEATAIAR
jgi:hypothetical protein